MGCAYNPHIHCFKEGVFVLGGGVNYILELRDHHLGTNNNIITYKMYVYNCTSLPSPSNRSFYRKIAGYRMGVGDHEVV